MWNRYLFVLVLLCVTPTSQADENVETVDTYAKHILNQSLHPPQAQVQGDMKTSDDKGLVLPQGPIHPFQLLYIQGTRRSKQAYLLVDNRYGQSVRVGDTLKKWHIRTIGADYVDIVKGNEHDRLLFDTAMADSSSSKNGVRSQGSHYASTPY